jgi:hypothetical protein
MLSTVSNGKSSFDEKLSTTYSSSLDQYGIKIMKCQAVYLVLQPLHACYPTRLLERVELNTGSMRDGLELFMNVVQDLTVYL